MSTAFFPAISYALLNSLLHGAFLFALYKSADFLLLNNTIWRYRIGFITLILMFADFTGHFFYHLLHENESHTFFGIPVTYNESLFEQIENWFSQYAFLIGCLYLTGLLLFSVWMTAGLIQLQNIRKKLNVATVGEWQKQLDFLSGKMGLRKTVKLFLPVKGAVPFTIGYLKPVIIVPLAMLSQMPAEQMEAILLHELAHIKRNDYLFNLIQRFIETLLFFNPFAWLIGNDIRNLRELCCDDLVIRHTQKPIVYARALTLAERYRTTQTALAMSSGGQKPGSLYQRIIRITTMKNTTSPTLQKLAVAFTIAVAFSALAFSIPDTLQKKNARQKSKAKIDTVKLELIPQMDTTKANKQKSASPKKMKKTVEEIEIMPPPPPPQEPGKSKNKNTVKLPPPPPPPVEPKKKTSKVENHTSAELETMNSPEFQKQIADVKANAEALRKKFDSPEWKKKIADIQANAIAMQKKFDSPEFKAQQEKLKRGAEALSKQYDSPEWKQKIAAIQANAEAIQKKYDSPKWKAQIEAIQKNAVEIEKQFNTTEWKAQQKLMEKQSAALQKQFNSPQ